MRILHTSDWHIGRTFHGYATLGALGGVLEAMAQLVRDHDVDVVAIAGDVFDSATPSGPAYDLLTHALMQLREAGAQVIATSGNHDSPARLGFQSAFSKGAGIHVLTKDEELAEPVTLNDSAGPVHFYGIPYLEPALIRHKYPDRRLKTQADALSFAMDSVRRDLERRGGRAVVLAHCFAQGIGEVDEDVLRDITAGGIDLVPTSVFSGVDYVALGHIHSRAVLEPQIRYSGAPLHYSFSEAGRPRGAWLVEIADDGAATSDWLDLPVPRPLRILKGTLEDLLVAEEWEDAEEAWVAAVLTDTVRPLDAMRKLRSRFPYCATLSHEPAGTSEDGASSYAERVHGKSDTEIVSGFLSHVRSGVGPTKNEAEDIRRSFEAVAAGEGNK